MNIGFKEIYKISFGIVLLGLLVLIGDFGFEQTVRTQNLLNGFYFIVLIISISTTILRYIEKEKTISKKVFIFDILSISLTIIILYLHLLGIIRHDNSEYFYNDIWMDLVVVLTFIREIAEVRINYKRTLINPAQLFILSFLFITLLGALMLMLPNATHEGISFLDALFTSTSAVCVTGLVVVDTSSYFTLFGQFIILGLIQIGGLGILTFASYFSYFFKGGTSYENQLAISDMTSSQKIGEVFSTLKYILLITFTVEIIGAALIFSSLDTVYFHSFFEKAFFSVFHSVSAFCNAGFSTLPNGLYEVGFRYNYFMQSVIILIFVLGGLGFPIVVNILTYVKSKFLRLITFSKEKVIYKPWVLNLNSRITLITTMSINLVAFIIFFISEYHNTLSEHHLLGKIITALFGATTPRTAGFNTIDMTTLNFPTIMLIFLLMWIGASPASTGGGIKTSTFAIATLNILSLARGKAKIEVYRREIADISVRRAFAVISLSLIIIGLGIMLISIFDSEKDLMSIAFECFSAYSTVGLSIGITASLSRTSKLVIILMMFVGRVSMLSVIIAFFKKSKYKNYQYPTEDITIN
jgi:trk system potassium uptake protein TrkH